MKHYNDIEVVGDVKAQKLKKKNGTSNQFLKADGSVDDSSYNNYSDSDAVSAINSDPNHSSNASHDYFSGDYEDLTNKPDSLIRYVTPPNNANSPGNVGDRAIDDNFVYECYYSNKWTRYAIDKEFTGNVGDDLAKPETPEILSIT